MWMVTAKRFLALPSYSEMVLERAFLVAGARRPVEADRLGCLVRNRLGRSKMVNKEKMGLLRWTSLCQADSVSRRTRFQRAGNFRECFPRGLDAAWTLQVISGVIAKILEHHLTCGAVQRNLRDSGQGAEPAGLVEAKSF